MNVLTWINACFRTITLSFCLHLLNSDEFFYAQDCVKMPWFALNSNMAFNVCCRRAPLDLPAPVTVWWVGHTPRLIEFIDSRVIICLTCPFTWTPHVRRNLSPPQSPILLDKTVITSGLQARLPCLRLTDWVIKSFNKSHFDIQNVFFLYVVRI